MKKNEIKIRSNPYEKHIDYFWNNEYGQWVNMKEMDRSPFNFDRFTSASISRIAYDVLNEIKKLNNSKVGIKITFEGTDDDFDDFSSVKETYFSEYNMELVRGSNRMMSAKDVMQKIEESFDRLNKYFEDYPDQKTEEFIAKYTDAVKPAIAICVMGLYSSGKSAFINSIIGQEILPSASDPATAKIYKICNSERNEIIFRFQNDEYKLEFEDTKWRCDQNPSSEIIERIKKKMIEVDPKTSAQYIYWTLYELNEFAKEESCKRHKELVMCAEKYLSRAEFNDCKKDDDKIEKLISKYRIKELVSKGELKANKLDDIIEVRMNFVHSFLPLGKFSFVIYDTPGSNSVMFREHADILKNSLDQQTNGMPIFVTNPDTMDNTDNNEIMEMIDELGSALDTSNMMMVVTKSDEKSKTLKKKAENKDLVVMKWKASRVYFVSSIIGLGGKKSNPEDENEWIDEDYYSAFYEKMDKFRNPESKFYLSLPEYNILPKDSEARIAEKTKSIKESARMLWNSGIPCVEEEIGIFAEKYAGYNKCSQAIQYLTDAAKMVKNDIEDAQEKVNASQSEIIERLDIKKKELEAELREACSEKIKEFVDNFPRSVIHDPTEKYLNNKERIKKIVNMAYMDSPGYYDDAKLLYFSNNIESCLRKDISMYSKDASLKTDEYWKECETELKDSLLQIVVGNPHLTDSEREILKEVVLRGAHFTNDHKYLNIRYTTAIERKRFLFFKWSRINLEKAKEVYEESLREDINCSNYNAIINNESCLNNWVNRMLNELIGVISSWNPALIELNKKLEKQKQIIKEKEKEKDFIENQIDTVKGLLRFEEE